MSIRAFPITLFIAALAGSPARAEPVAPESVAPEPVALESTRKPFNGEGGALDGVGALAFRGALVLSAGDSRFGGFSGLTVSRDGKGLIAVTDEGNWLSARLRYDERGWLAGLEDGRMGALAGPGDGRSRAKENWDAESLARLPDGALLVSFERDHRIWRYPNSGFPLTQTPKAWPVPAAFAALEENGGIEALTEIGDGRMLAIAEAGEEGADRVPAYLWTGETWDALTYGLRQDYRPCGATLLPNGDLIVLERRFSFLSGVAIRLRQVAVGDIVPGSRLEGRLLGELRAPLLVDNFEGVDARVGPGGETLIYLLSDDNFNVLQRNLLLMFALNP